MRAPAVLALLALGACDKKPAGEGGELSRADCITLVTRVNELKNTELGRVGSAEQRRAVDRCMESGTRAQLECVQFAQNAGEIQRCDELAR